MMIIVRKGVETQLSVLRTVSNAAQRKEATDTEAAQQSETLPDKLTLSVHLEDRDCESGQIGLWILALSLPRLRESLGS